MSPEEVQTVAKLAAQTFKGLGPCANPLLYFARPELDGNSHCIDSENYPTPNNLEFLFSQAGCEGIELFLLELKANNLVKTETLQSVGQALAGRDFSQAIASLNTSGFDDSLEQKVLLIPKVYTV